MANYNCISPVFYLNSKIKINLVNKLHASSEEIIISL